MAGWLQRKAVRRLLVLGSLAALMLLAAEIVLLAILVQRSEASRQGVPTIDTTKIAILQVRTTATLALTTAAPLTATAPTTTRPPLATNTVLPTMASPTPAVTATPLESVTPSPTATATASSTPTATPTTAATATPPVITPVHIVQSGESLGVIAGRYGIEVDELLAANGLAPGIVIVPGQALGVPIEQTVTPTFTPSMTPSPTPIPPTATYAPLPTMLHGIPLELLILMDEDTRTHIQEIYQRGQSLGNDPHAYSKLGDSTIENPHFMTRFDEPGGYNLGMFNSLEPAVDYYRGSHARDSVAVKRGLNSWVAFDPMWADDPDCLETEGPLACEIRLHRPSVMFIRLGTNDFGSDGFRDNLSEIVQYCIDNGVIPLLGTKADRYRDPYNQVNRVIHEVADAYNVPLWDFDRAAEMLPDRGITEDGTHLTTFFTQDYRTNYALWTGYGLHNMLALLTLNDVWRTVTPPDALATVPMPTVVPSTIPEETS